jgi:thiol-disulfide isomerase/thioredoxin
MLTLCGAALRFAVHFSILVSISAAAWAAGSKPHVEIDPQARKVMDDFSTYYKTLNAFQVTIDTQISVERNGEPLKQSSLQRISAVRPNKLALSVQAMTGGTSSQVAWCCDGANCYAASVTKGPSVAIARHAVEQSPQNWEGIVRNRYLGTLLMSATLHPISFAILTNDPAASVLSNSISVSYSGRESLDGIECHVLRSVADASTRNAGGDFDWQLWIEVGERPLVRQSKVTSGEITSKLMKLSAISTYKDWEVNLSFPCDTFVFVRPEGTTEVDSFTELFTGKPAKTPDSPRPHPLLGQPAPPLSLDLLDGGSIDFASSKNQNVVILDFWSTSCLSCIRTLPIIDSVAQEYEAKGVRLYAVNVGQSADEARKFLQDVKWTGKATILLDRNEVTAKSYSVSSMPHTVLIGKDGSVQVVRIGKSKDLEAQLRIDLESLLAGKNLAAEELAAAKKNNGDHVPSR